MRSTTRVIAAGGAILILGALAILTERAADPIPGKTTVRIAAAILLGLGASLLASGVAARLVSNQVVGLDISEAIEALRGTSPLTRSNQSLEITLRIIEGQVYLNAEHRFDMVSSFKRKRRLTFKINTDVGRLGSKGGFDCVVEPDGRALRDDELAPFVQSVVGKPQFEKVYEFRPGVEESFTVETFATFRLADRLIWTVEHISRDFKVRVNDYTGLQGIIDIKINHHQWREIGETRRTWISKEGTIMEFELLGAVLPYQGFELQWQFQPIQPDTSSS